MIRRTLLSILFALHTIFLATVRADDGHGTLRGNASTRSTHNNNLNRQRALDVGWVQYQDCDRCGNSNAWCRYASGGNGSEFDGCFCKAGFKSSDPSKGCYTDDCEAYFGTVGVGCGSGEICSNEGTNSICYATSFSVTVESDTNGFNNDKDFERGTQHTYSGLSIDTTILELKQAIKNDRDIKVSKQKIKDSVGGTTLSGSQTLRDVGIYNSGSTLYLYKK